jgi:uncharacterized membrane protein
MRLIRLLKHDLASETVDWVNAGIISKDQAETICARYGVDYGNRVRHAYGYQVLAGLGYLFIGLALITLISANWDTIPRGARMGGLVALTLAANLMGLHKFKNEAETQATAWFFLGSMFYGASIMLIAQIYHIDEHYPDGIFWWAMGVLPIAILMESSVILMLSLSLGFIWFFVESSLDFYPALFPVFLAATAWQLSRGRQSYILFLALISGVAFWAEYAVAWIISEAPGFQPGPENIAVGAGLVILLHGLSKWLSHKKNLILVDYGALLGVWVLRFAIISLCVFSFKEPWRELIAAPWKMPELTIALSFFLSALALWLSYQAKAPIASTAAFVLLFMASLLAVIEVENVKYVLLFQSVYNIALFAMGIWLIVRGIRNNISHYFYLGILTILAMGLLRYVDLIGDYLGATLLFGLFAAILLMAAKYWKFHHERGVRS